VVFGAVCHVLLLRRCRFEMKSKDAASLLSDAFCQTCNSQLAALHPHQQILQALLLVLLKPTL
jgi:hypothetical protein